MLPSMRTGGSNPNPNHKSRVITGILKLIQGKHPLLTLMCLKIGDPRNWWWSPYFPFVAGLVVVSARRREQFR